MIVKITIEKVSDGFADDGTSNMQTDIVFKGFTRRSDEKAIANAGLIRDKVQALLAATLEAFNE